VTEAVTDYLTPDPMTGLSRAIGDAMADVMRRRAAIDAALATLPALRETARSGTACDCRIADFEGWLAVETQRAEQSLRSMRETQARADRGTWRPA
jgi:hypothetical protein